MEIPFLSAAAVGIAMMTLSPATEATSRGPDRMSLVGADLFASESPIDRWGDPVQAEDLPLEALGTVADVVTDAGGQGHLVVRVGGLWGWGAQEVEVGVDRLHLLHTEAGEPRLVVDLSAEGAEPALL